MMAAGGQEISGPVRVLSDLHLAHDASQVSEVSLLRPLLEGCSRVIFNGDTCEQLYSGWRERGTVAYRELEALCEELGVEPVFLRGNHDPRISELGWMEASSRRVVITHGDLLLENPSPWSREYLSRKEEIRSTLQARGDGDGSLSYRVETLAQINTALAPSEGAHQSLWSRLQLLSGLWPPERIFQILKVWIMMGNNAEAFVQRFFPHCRVLVFGHFHRAAVITRGGRTYCNTGAFMDGSRSLAVDVDDESVVVRRVLKQEGAFRLGAEVQRLSL